jgi:hypothetical protein
MLSIRKLELHVTHSCNLACESCSHYSDQGHKGLVAVEDADRWMGLWSGRLAPLEFSLLGGEPAIHPDLPEFVRLTRAHWPSTHIEVVSNGLLLSRHPDLPHRLAEAGNSQITISVHHESEAYAQRLAPVWEMTRGWIDDYGIRVLWRMSHKNWTRRYTGLGASMQPFEDGAPRLSWENCPAKFCPQLLESGIWKCGPLAYLPLQQSKYGLSEKWADYLAYRPLAPGCSDEEMLEFFSRQEEPECAMCPASPERFALPVPIRALQAKAESPSHLPV